MLTRTLLSLLSLLTVPLSLGAQTLDDQRAAGEAVRAFLDCPEGCDFNFLRVETPWVSFVRDPSVADVYLLVTRQATGSGGRQYTINALGQAAYASRGDTLVFSTEPNITDDARRSEVLRFLQLALVPYASHTAQGRTLRVVAPKRADGVDEPGTGVDRWNSWVFAVGANGDIQGEAKQGDVGLNGRISARRITPALKTGVSFRGTFDQSRYTLNAENVVTSTRSGYGGGGVAVRSLGPHWGAGAEISAGSSTFQNTRLSIRAAPAIEYSFWSYEESTRRQLTAQYSLGVSSYRYREETIFDRIAETRPTEALVFAYDVRQPWGSATAGLEASNYLDDFSQRRLAFDGDMSVRVARGLALEIGGRASLIHDQLSLVKRGATAEEILLRRRALQTNYRYDVRVGFSYTFGSIFNSVVNPRFGTGPGRILR